VSAQAVIRTPRTFSSRVPGWRALSPGRRDAVFAALLTVLAGLTVLFPLEDAEVDVRALDVWGFLLATGTAVPVAWRRTRPTAAAAASTACSVTYTAFGYGTNGGDVALMVLAYSLAAYSQRRHAVVTTAVMIGVLAGQLVVLVLLGSDGWTWADPLAAGGSLALAALIGDNRRIRRSYVAELVHHAEQAERVRQLEAERAVSEERARIARDLHDVVAHHVTGIVVFAGAAERTGDDLPEPVERSLAQIKESGTDALAAMRELVTVLRSTPESGTRPAFGGIFQLVEGARVAGADVRLEVTGEEHVEEHRASPEVAGCMFRIVQEALTNATKHAPGAPVVVRLEHEPSRMRVGVCNDAPVPTDHPASALPSGGHGLRGMRERVEALGGTITIGPTATGGWVVQAALPLGQPPAHPDAQGESRSTTQPAAGAGARR